VGDSPLVGDLVGPTATVDGDQQVLTVGRKDDPSAFRDSQGVAGVIACGLIMGSDDIATFVEDIRQPRAHKRRGG
jgi:hypothetical protein